MVFLPPNQQRAHGKTLVFGDPALQRHKTFSPEVSLQALMKKSVVYKNEILYVILYTSGSSVVGCRDVIQDHFISG